MNVLINPSAVDVLNLITQVLIANAQRGLTPSVNMLPIQEIALTVVNGNSIIPYIIADTPTTNG
jgi:hypothetical protein